MNYDLDSKNSIDSERKTDIDIDNIPGNSNKTNKRIRGRNNKRKGQATRNRV
jgi:hypothetical protein